MGQVWSVNSLGGYAYSDNLSKELRTAVQPALRFRQFADIKDPEHQGMHRGSLFHWNVYSDVATQGGTLVETNTMPETNFTISQGTMTVLELGNSVPYTGLLDDLSEQPVKEIIHKILKNDAKKVMDSLAATEFNKTPLRVAPTSGTDTAAVTLTTNGTCSTTNNLAMGKEHVKTIADTMKERNIPAYTDDDYYSLAWPTTFRSVKNDLESVKAYTETGYGFIMKGEVGRYEGIRFTEQTNVAKATLGTPASAWTNAKSNWAFFFGADTVAEGVVVPEEIRGKLPGDYGRDMGVAWYSLDCFGLCHTDAAQARVVMWDSAA